MKLQAMLQHTHTHTHTHTQSDLTDTESACCTQTRQFDRVASVETRDSEIPARGKTRQLFYLFFLFFFNTLKKKTKKTKTKTKKQSSEKQQNDSVSSKRFTFIHIYNTGYATWVTLESRLHNSVVEQ
jgi:hypothetical protein